MSLDKLDRIGLPTLIGKIKGLLFTKLDKPKGTNKQYIDGTGNLQDFPTIIDSTQSDWNETDSKNPAFIKNKPDLTTYLKTDGSNATEKTAEAIINKIETPGGNLLTDDGSIIATTSGGTDWFKTKLSNLWSWIKKKTDIIYPNKETVLESNNFSYNMKSANTGIHWCRILQSKCDYTSTAILVNINTGCNTRYPNNVTFIVSCVYRFRQCVIISRNEAVDYIKAVRLVRGKTTSDNCYVDVRLDIKESTATNPNGLYITYTYINKQYSSTWNGINIYTEVDSLNKGEDSLEVSCSYTRGMYISGTIETTDRIVGSKFVKRNGTSTQFLMGDGSIKTLGTHILPYNLIGTENQKTETINLNDSQYKISGLYNLPYVNTKVNYPDDIGTTGAESCLLIVMASYGAGAFQSTDKIIQIILHGTSIYSRSYYSQTSLWTQWYKYPTTTNVKELVVPINGSNSNVAKGDLSGVWFKESGNTLATTDWVNSQLETITQKYETQITTLRAENLMRWGGELIQWSDCTGGSCKTPYKVDNALGSTAWINPNTLEFSMAIYWDNSSMTASTIKPTLNQNLIFDMTNSYIAFQNIDTNKLIGTYKLLATNSHEGHITAYSSSGRTRYFASFRIRVARLTQSLVTAIKNDIADYGANAIRVTLQIY